MRVRRSRLLALLLAWPLVAGCRKGEEQRAGDAGPAPGPLCVALLLPGPIDDGGWNQSGYEGLQLIARELGAHTRHTAQAPAADYEQIMERYAQEGCDFVVGHGGEFIPAAEAVAERYPDTKFAVIARYPGNNRNLGALSFRDGELGYLGGVVAALVSRSRRVVFVGGVAYAHMEEEATLFVRGAKSVDPGIEVAIEWLQSWSDREKARRVARAYIARGFDVLAPDADEAGLEVLRAAQAAGVHAIGWNRDQYDLAPGAVVTSMIKRTPVLLLKGAQLVKAGRWEGHQYKFGLADGAQGLAPFHGLTPAQEDRVRTVEADVRAGRIDVAP